MSKRSVIILFPDVNGARRELPFLGDVESPAELVERLKTAHDEGRRSRPVGMHKRLVCRCPDCSARRN